MGDSGLAPHRDKKENAVHTHTATHTGEKVREDKLLSFILGRRNRLFQSIMPSGAKKRKALKKKKQQEAIGTSTNSKGFNGDNLHGTFRSSLFWF